MRIHATINERTVGRSFREKRIGRNGLTVIDRDLPAFRLKVSKNGRKTFFVRAARPIGRSRTILGSAEEMTAAEAREKAVAAIASAKAECETGPQFDDFAQEFMRRHRRRWKPSTRKGNRHLIDRYLVPFFRTMPVAGIARADVQRWFDSMSATPGNANRALPVLSVMMRQAELWDFPPQGSNPCRNMRRYKTTRRERYLSVDELKRLGFVLDHAEDRQAAAAIRLLLFTGARSSEVTGLRWDWIRGTRAVLRAAKTGGQAVHLGHLAIAVLRGIPLTRGNSWVLPGLMRGTHIAYQHGSWRCILSRAGIEDLHIHDLGHGFTNGGLPVCEVAATGKLLGRNEVQTTARYAHLANEPLKAAANSIASRITEVVGQIDADAEAPSIGIW